MPSFVTAQNQVGRIESFFDAKDYFWDGVGGPTWRPPDTAEFGVPFTLVDATHKTIWFCAVPGTDTLTVFNTGTNIIIRGTVQFILNNQVTCEFPFGYQLPISGGVGNEGFPTPQFIPFIPSGWDLGDVGPGNSPVLGFASAHGAVRQLVYMSGVQRICNADFIQIKLEQFDVVIECPRVWLYIAVTNEYNF